MRFSGSYPTTQAGYVFLQWSNLGYFHEGWDINYGSGMADNGEPVVACSDGEIIYIGSNYPGYGEHLYIKCNSSDGVVYLHYAHLKKGSIIVKENDIVMCGQKIAECGNTGWDNMSSHLHFSISNSIIDNNYNFYPKGWTKDKVSTYFYDPYYFIKEEYQMYEMEAKAIEEYVKQIEALNSKISELQSVNAHNSATLVERDKRITFLENSLNAINKELAFLKEDYLKDKNLILELQKQRDCRFENMNIFELLKLFFTRRK